MWHATLCSDVLLYTDHMFVYRLISVIPNICVSFVSVDLLEKSCRVYCTDVFYLHSVPCFVSAHCLDLSWKSCKCVDERGTLLLPYEKFHAWKYRGMKISCMNISCMNISLSCMKLWAFHAWKWKFRPGMIFTPQKSSWVVGLYTTLCMEFSPMNIFGQNVHFQAWKFQRHSNGIYETQKCWPKIGETLQTR